MSYKRGDARVEYDPKETNQDQIKRAINSTGYKVNERSELCASDSPKAMGAKRSNAPGTAGFPKRLAG